MAACAGVGTNHVKAKSLLRRGSNSINNRIVEGDYIAGRSPSDDLGNAQTDVLMYFNTIAGDLYAPDFTYTSKPSNQEFDVGAFIGNNMPYRTNPDIKPILNLKPLGWIQTGRLL